MRGLALSLSRGSRTVWIDTTAGVTCSAIETKALLRIGERLDRWTVGLDDVAVAAVLCASAEVSEIER